MSRNEMDSQIMTLAKKSNNISSYPLQAGRNELNYYLDYRLQKGNYM